MKLTITGFTKMEIELIVAVGSLLHSFNDAAERHRGRKTRDKRAVRIRLKHKDTIITSILNPKKRGAQ